MCEITFLLFESYSNKRYIPIISDEIFFERKIKVHKKNTHAFVINFNIGYRLVKRLWKKMKEGKLGYSG